MIVEESINNNEPMDDSNIETALAIGPVENDYHNNSTRERKRTEPNRFSSIRFGSTRLEPNSNRLLEKKTKPTELEPEKVGPIRSLNSTTCPSYGIAHGKIESDGIPDRHTKKYQ
jgi:hypothetical protein